MASSGHRIHPTEDMISPSSYSYRGALVSRASDLDNCKISGGYVTLEEARWSDMRKRIGLPRLPKRHSSPQEDYERIKEEQCEFIREHFHMKECKKFVPKPDQNVKLVRDLKCHCGEFLYNHAGLRKSTRPASNDLELAHSFLVPTEYTDIVKNERAKPPDNMPTVSWTTNESVRPLTTNAFGKITFDIEQIGGKKPAKYIRLADTDSEKDALNLMLKYWRIMEPVPPKLVISVIGGAKNFKLDGRMRDTFASGLIKAAKTTSAWLISSGFNMGVMKAVGQAVHEGQTFQWDNDRMTHVLRCIGIAPWGYVKSRHFLESSDGRGKFNAHYRTSNNILHGQPVHLNPDHTHFIFVDDGMRNRYGGVAGFRARFERHIMSSSGLGIPVVLVVVEGGQDAITDAQTSLNHGIPVVVCSGTGRAADILAYAYTHTIKTPTGETYMRDKHTQVLANKLFLAYGKSWGKKAEEEMEKYLRIVQDCCKDEDRVIVFPINKHEDLDLAILTVLLKAQAGVSATDHRLNQLKLALTWNRADIAQEEIFREDVNWESGHLDEAMTMALDQDKVDFVKLILNQGIIMKEYLTVQRLEKLYNNIPKHLYLYFLLQRSSKKSQFVLADVSRFLTNLLDKYDDERLSDDAADQPDSKLPAPSHMTSFKKKVMFHETTDTDDGDESNRFKKPYKQLMIWAVLMNRVQLALFFWEMGEEPISSAIAVTKLCLGIFKKIPKYQTHLREEFVDMKILFEKLAICVLDECNSVDPEKAMMLVERKSLMWNKMSCLQMASAAKDEAFLSSISCQNSINTTWKHGILSGWKYVLMGIMCPPLIYFVEVANLGEKTLTNLQKILTFYTAPMTKFGCYTLDYIVFLSLFSFFVLVDFKPVPSVVEWVCIIWILSFLTGEIHTFLSFPIPTMKSKIRDWFRLPNIIDISNLVLVFIAFAMRWFPQFFLAAKMIYCFNVIIFFLRLLRFYTAHSKLGPKLIMISRMFEELAMFVMVLFVFLLAYGVASQGLLYPQRVSSYLIIKDILYYPYWQLYGEIFLEEIETDTVCLETLANTTTVTDFNNTCRTYNWMVPILLAAYLCVGNILLLNLLIAIFSHVFDTVEENSMVIWKFQMYYLVMEYDIKSSIIPPFNLIKHIYLMCKWIFRRSCCKKTTEGVQYMERHLMYLALFEKEMVANYLRNKKTGQSNTVDAQINILQKRVDELTKLIEDELIADQNTVFGPELTCLSTVPKAPETPEIKSKWPTVKQVLKLGTKMKMEEQGLEVENILDEEKSKLEDLVMEEVRKKHKKKKVKEKKKKKRERQRAEEGKELNINLDDGHWKPDYSEKYLDSSPTRGHHSQVPPVYIPLSPRSSFLKSRSDALPWTDSEEDVYEKTSMTLNPLSIQTRPLPRELQSPEFTDDENYSARTPTSSKLFASRRARRQGRKRISDLENRLVDLERSTESHGQSHSYGSRTRSSHR